MYYSAIGLLAAMILLIENRDILLDSKGAFEKPAWKVYRRFLFAVLAYYVTDILWGMLESLKLPVLLFADTTVYFVAMAVGVLFWVQFTLAYLEEKSVFGRFLVMLGRIVAGFITLLSVINIFEPVLFTVDSACVYTALPMRYVILVAQIALLLLISVRAFASLRQPGGEKRSLALALFGLIMALFLFAQLWFPYYPLYSIAYLLGTSLLHTYVVNDEKEEYKRGLDEARQRRELQETVVSLMNNMPVMTFAKDASTGVYVAGNRAFADYAHKNSPEDLIGLTDAQLFDPETARHFTETDRIALSMDEPYIYYEEAQDAVGSQRQLQTTKLKYYNFAGKLCVLGMCEDVTDMVRIQRENATTKEAYEQARSTGLIFTHIAQALAGGYMMFYYVNVDSEGYIKYRNDEESGSLIEDERGWHFFEACRLTIGRVVHSDDRAAVLAAMRRRTLMAALDENRSFIMTFRCLTETEPRYVSLKVSRMDDDREHIILGISDIDELMKHRRAAMRVKEEQIAYNRLKALNGNYLWLYIVDPETGVYRELSAIDDKPEGVLNTEGEDFFTSIRREAKGKVYPEDLNRVLTTFTKENVMAEIERAGVFTLRHRTMLGGRPIYALLKAATVMEKGGIRLVVGLINVDEQIRQEEEYGKRFAQAQVKANVDALTGVKNKHAYLEAEQRLNDQLAEQPVEFAVVLLDVNDLKKVNDSEGHSAGDQLIRDACKIICDTFKHSPVFRIGGDEFAVISRGSDYACIDGLVARMDAYNASAMESGRVVIACGMSKYAGDGAVAPVFERADARMYENKSALKAART